MAGTSLHVVGTDGQRIPLRTRTRNPTGLQNGLHRRRAKSCDRGDSPHRAVCCPVSSSGLDVRNHGIMKQLLQNLKTGAITLEDVPAPALQPGGVVVRTRRSIVSAGTERAVMDFARQSLLGKARSRPDLVRRVLSRARTDGVLAAYRAAMSRLENLAPLGYSSAGVVVEAGDDVDDLAPGDLVACGGSGYASHAEFVYVPRNLVARLPDGVAAEQGAFATLGAIALQGIRRADLTPGEKVAVIGLGLVGRLTAQVLAAYGFPVLGLDTDASRVETGAAAAMDGAAVIGRDDVQSVAQGFSQGAGLDAVIVTAATGSSDPVRLAGEILRHRGRVSVVGDVGMDIPRRVYYGKELDLRVSRSYGPGRYDPSYEEHGLDYPLPYVRWTEQRNMEEFVRLLAAGRIDVEAITTHHFAIDRAQEAYDLLSGGSGDAPPLAIAIDYPAAEEPPVRRMSLRPDRAAGRTRRTGTVRVGLIGTGSFARGTVIPALKSLKGAEIRAVAAATGAHARETAARSGAAYATTDYRELLADPDVDLIVAATRHHLNARIAAEALGAGKHVHVEKPLALNREELQTVTDAARQSDAILAVGFNRRFAPFAVRVRDHFAPRTTPLMLTCRVNAGFVPADHWVHDPVDGGGRILGEVCHFVDLLQFFAGTPPKRVYATRLPPQGDSVQADDNVLATLEFEDGSRGSIAYSALGADRMPKELVEVMGGGRGAVLDNFRRLSLYDGARVSTARGSQDKGHRDQFRTLIQTVASRGPPPVAVDELLLSSLSTVYIVESLSAGTPIDVDLTALLKSGGE